MQSKFGCPKCGVDNRTQLRINNGKDGFLEYFKSELSAAFELLSDYVDVKSEIRVRCLRNGHEIKTTPDSLKQGYKNGCPVCIRLEPKISAKEFVKSAKVLMSMQN